MTPQQIEAMKLALEALEKLWSIIDDIDTYSDMVKADDKSYRTLVERRQRMRFKETGITTDGYKLSGGAITALEEALAQPEQDVDWEKLYRLEVKKKEALAAKYERDIKPLTRIVPMAQTEQEPVISKWVLREVYFDEDGEPTMHRSTPQRKPLTDEEIINKCLESGFERNCLGWSFTYGKLDYHLLKLARAIEAAHNIKENT